MRAKSLTHFTPQAETPEPDVLGHEGIQMNRLTHRIEINGRQIYLSYKEFRLLWLLLLYKGAIVRLKEIKEKLWHDPWTPMDGAIQCYISRLRQKLGHHFGALIQSVSGIGYKIESRTLGKPPQNPANLSAV